MTAGARAYSTRFVRAADTRASAIVLLACVPFAAFWAVLVARETSFFVYPDNVRQIYPWYQKFASAIHHGYLPLWDANVNAGNSFVGEIQTGVFYPVNLIFIALFGTRDGISIGALDWLVVVHFVLASLGTYLFCRALGTSHIAAAFAGVLFSYTGPHANRAMAQVPIFFTDSLLPFAAFFTAKYASTGRFAFAAAAGAIVGTEMLAGHFAAPFLSLLVCSALIVTRSTTLGNRLGAAGTLFTATAIVGSPQLFFGLQHFVTSYRIVGTPEPILATARIPISAIDELALKPSQLLTFFDPIHFTGGMDGNGIFVGFVPIVLVALCFTRRSVRAQVRRSFPRLWALYALAVLSLVLAIGTATPIGRLWYALPLLSSVVRESGRYVLIFQFVFATLCAISLQALSQAATCRPAVRKGMSIDGTAIVAASALMALVAYLYFQMPQLRQGLLPVGLSVLAFVALPRKAAVLALVALGVFTSVESATTLAQPVSTPTYAPRAYRESVVFQLPEACYPTCRVVVDTDDVVPSNIGDVLRVQTIGGYTALTDRKYVDFLRSDPASEFAYDVLNVRYEVTTKPIAGRTPIARDEARHLLLYERSSVFPRAFSFGAALTRDRSKNDVRFSVVAYDDVNQRFSVRVDKPEAVVFSEQFYPGWTATVDGRPTTLYVANVHSGPAILRTVRVPAGTHTVEFRYLGL